MKLGSAWIATMLLLPAAMAGGDDFAPGGAPFGIVAFGPTLVPDTFLIAAFKSQPISPPGSVVFFRLDVGKDKTQTLVVRAFGLPDGIYQVVRVGVGGTTPLGSFTVAANDVGKLVPDAPSDGSFIDWFENEDSLQVLHEGELFFTIQLYPLFGGDAAGADSMVNGARLIAVGDDLDARGRLRATADDIERSVDLRLERLDPGPYVIEAAELSAFFVVVGEGGKASLRLASPLAPGAGSAYFNSPGEVVRVRNAAGEVVLEAQMPWDPYLELNRPPKRQKFQDVGEGAADGLQVDFIQTDWAYDGGLKKGWLAWQRDPLGAATITVEVAAPKFAQFTPYDLFVGDTLIGSFGTEAASAAPVQASFAVGPEVDLRGQRVEVRQGFQVGLSLIFPQSVPAALRTYHKDVRKPHHLHLDLLNPGIDLDATGLLDWRLKAGVQHLLLQIHDLPAGAYDVVLDGSVVAAAALTVETDGGEAQAQFSTGGVDAGSLPLDFEVTGSLEIRAAGSSTVFLQQELGS